MRKDIETFYDATKIDRVGEVQDGDAPVTHVEIFHKSYPRLPRVALPAMDVGGELDTLLRRRRSTRTFTGEAIRLEELAEALDGCSIVDTSGPMERRTYPSAGARFPVETYVIAFQVDGLEPGCWHFDVEARALELLWKRDLRSLESEIVSPAVKRPSATLVFTAVLSRAEVKYGARAYPFSLLEAGHMAQNVSLACTKLGIGSCPVGGFVNDTVSRCLDLTRDEIPIYGMALGRTT